MRHYTLFPWRLACPPLILLLAAMEAGAVESPSLKLLVWGDSLSAAHGIPRELGWVALLRQRLAPRGIEVSNGSISGETSNGGLARLPEALRRIRPDILVLELGANDGLRGQPLTRTRENLRAMIEQARQAGAQVVLIGMRLPPNYGPDYTEAFHAIYRELAREYRLPLVPFLLEGVASDFSLMQADGLHPTAAAQKRLLENAWPAVKQALERAAGPGQATPELLSEQAK